jgi:hypothetical protein
MNILESLKSIQFYLDQVSTDKVPGMPGYFLNTAKNQLMELVADGERRTNEKLQQQFADSDDKRGDPLG